MKVLGVSSVACTSLLVSATVLNLDSLHSVKNTMKSFEAAEFETSLNLFLDAADFDSLIEDYTASFERIVTSRLETALSPYQL